MLEHNQVLMNKLTRFGRVIGSGDTIRGGTGARSRVIRWGHMSARFDLYYKDGTPYKAEVIMLRDHIAFARYVLESDKAGLLNLVYYDGIITVCERTL